MSAIYEENRFNDENCPNKVAIEDMFTTYAGQRMASDALSITGPNYPRHAKNILLKIVTTKASIFTVVEIERKTLDIILVKADQCSITAEHRFNCKYKSPIFYFGDVSRIDRSFRFEDLDLTCTWDQAFPIFYDRLLKQSKIRQRQKCMIFTVSERNGCGPENMIKGINDLLAILNAKISGFNDAHEGFDTDNKACNNRESNEKRSYRYVQDPNWAKRGRIHHMEAFKYKDESPMFTFMIMYK